MSDSFSGDDLPFGGDVVVDLAVAGPMPDIFLLVAHPAGVYYSHQCGGHACVHPMQKGFLVPVFGTQKVVRQLDRFFAGELCSQVFRGIDDEQADVVDRILANHEKTKGMTVDRERLNLDAEAWVYIKIAPDAPLLTKSFRLVTNLDLSSVPEIVLLWPNSD